MFPLSISTNMENMPIGKEILNMLNLGRKPFLLYFYIEISKNRKG